MNEEPKPTPIPIVPAQRGTRILSRQQARPLIRMLLRPLKQRFNRRLKTQTRKHKKDDLYG